MDVQVNEGTLGFQIPTFGEMLTFMVKGFFVVAGIAALVMLLWGALAWVLSGGDKEKVEAARDRMTAAIIGVFMILVALSIVWTLEQIVFQRTVCFGLSCPVTIPRLLNSSDGNGGAGGSGGSGGSGSSTSSHIFARPTASTSNGGTRGTTGGSGGSTGGSTGSSGGTQSGTKPTPTGLQKLPGTGL